MRDRDMKPESTRPNPTAPLFWRVLGSALAALTLGALLLTQPFAEATADGQRVDNPAEWKDEWKERYMALRIEEARLEKTVALATKEYADANRRNYRRSGVRHFHRVNAAAAEEKLEKVRARKAKLAEEIDSFGGFAWWIDEWEEIQLNDRAIDGLGSYAAGERFGPARTSESAILPDDGTNPRFDRQEEKADAELPAALESLELGEDSEEAPEEESPAFDYIRWLEDNEAYGREVSPSEGDEDDRDD